MPLTSLLRSRRLAHKAAIATQQVIAFQLQQTWFALPIHAVQRVVPLGDVYGDPKQQGICLTLYQDQELLVLDVGQRIFGSVSESRTQGTQGFLLVVQSRAGALVGIPIVQPPVLKRVPDSAFTPLPQTYLASGMIRCLSDRMAHLEDGLTLFFLDPEQLFQGWVAATAATAETQPPTPPFTTVTTQSTNPAGSKLHPNPSPHLGEGLRS